MRTFAIGDIHGACRALIQVLERAEFDYEQDCLISLGDVADGWPETPECVDELLKIKNLIAIQGNHDWWTWRWLLRDDPEDWWFQFGGQATYDAYLKTRKDSDPRHLRFWDQQLPYYFDEQRNIMFVHAGYDPDRDFYEQNDSEWLWTRKLFVNALNASEPGGPTFHDVNNFGEVFVGHTNLRKYFEDDLPVKFEKVWNLDTSAKKGGPVTLMEVDTKQYWQSDPTLFLYPEAIPG